MKCRIVKLEKGGLIRLGNSLEIDNSHQEKMDAKAEAVGWLASVFNDFSFDQKLKMEAERLKPQIKLRLVPNGGVLLCVVYTQHVDSGYKSFDNMFVADSGTDYRAIMNKQLNMPKMMAAVHAAYNKMELYIWVTEI